jgi:hypothetical protein
MRRADNESPHHIEDYVRTAGLVRKHLRAISGKQSDDPMRAVDAIVQAVESPNPPHRLLLGNDTFEGVIKKLDELRKEFVAWEDVSRGVNFPKEVIAKIV